MSQVVFLSGAFRVFERNADWRSDTGCGAVDLVKGREGIIKAALLKCPPDDDAARIDAQFAAGSGTAWITQAPFRNSRIGLAASQCGKPILFTSGHGF